MVNFRIFLSYRKQIIWKLLGCRCSVLLYPSTFLFPNTKNKRINQLNCCMCGSVSGRWSIISLSSRPSPWLVNSKRSVMVARIYGQFYASVSFWKTIFTVICSLFFFFCRATQTKWQRTFENFFIHTHMVTKILN